ncbi:cytochrome c oxidase subunit 3 [Croceimicrobium sp.]|uniref:cytochrome c oxidase subunit 3 n=1 Tax=Croceimicrobium sp. TaxID=2828340 RepID=UPI003BA8A2FC|tara:strand:- start:1207 stop:2142 length:936 start_codon:yes stop_codon:yes gene_type:complete
MANGAALEQNTTAIWGGGRQPFGVSYGKMMMWFFLLSDALTFSGFLTAMGLYRFKYETTWPVAENVFTHFPLLHGEHPLLFVALMTFILILSSVTMVLAVNAGHKMNTKAVVLWLGLTIVGGFTFLGSQAWEWYHFINGDKGAVMLEDRTVMYVTPIDGNGEIISIYELITGQEKPHGDHTEFKTADMIAAFGINDNMTLRMPGKGTEEGAITLSREEAMAAMKGARVLQGAGMKANEYGNTLFANFFFFVTGFHGTHVFSGVVLNIIIFINVLMGTYERRGHYEMVEKVGLYWHFVDLVWVFVFTFFYLV